MVTLEDLKDELNIDFPDHDRKLERKLNSARDIISRYTDIYTFPKVFQITSDGCPLEFFEYPLEIVSVKDDSGKDVSFSRRKFRLSTEVIAPKGSVITLRAGGDDSYSNSAVDEGIIRLAVYLFENADANEITIPLDIQMIVNKERRSASII